MGGSPWAALLHSGVGMAHVTGIGGIFFRAGDPEGNPIELWEPPPVDRAAAAL